MPNHAEQLAQELNLNVKNVQGAIELIDQGNTIPFIARYRKEATGSMDDQVLRDLGDRLEYLRGLDKRKDEVTSSITEQGAMTPELTAALSKAKTLAEVEDIYRPYKPKRKTRASIAKARGLQPLATAIFRQDAAFDPEKVAADYLNDEVPDAAAALAGAQDIIAEAVSDDAACRAELRRYYRAFGRVASAKAKDEDSVYAQYYDYAEPLNKIPGHRVLALDRGEREGFLKVTIQVDAERAAGIVSWMFARKKTGGKSAELVDAAARDAYSRLIHPSLENELRQLGFSEQVRVIPDFAVQEIWPGVQDERGRILWAPNPGQPPQPLDKIASGGELSRFLLALASVQQDEEGATFIFDEVDAGVGGMTLNKLAEKLYALAETRQMLLITHWPQLAARARRHFQIVKVVRDGETFTLCSPLNKADRHTELARMAGGGAQGEALARSLEA